jgi:hypothetical protein
MGKVAVTKDDGFGVSKKFAGAADLAPKFRVTDKSHDNTIYSGKANKTLLRSTFISEQRYQPSFKTQV